MFDTMVITKAATAICATLLVFLLGNWAATEIYVPRNADAPQAFVIDTGEDDADDEPAVELTFEEAFEVADADAGSRLWSQCRACHALDDGNNGVGPHLYNIVDREIGVVSGFNYSGALTDAADVWTPENLSAFIENPSGWAPGTSMSFRGIGSVEDRANLIAYMEREG
jgi:cytochrome c